MITCEKKIEIGSSNWLDIFMDYNESSKKVKNYKSCVTDNAEAEILGGVAGELQEVTNILKDKIMFEHDPVAEIDLEQYNLTALQKSVLKLRLKYSSYTQIAEIIGSTPQAVFDVYKRAIHKLIKQKKGEVRLSTQQQKILLLYKEGKRQKEIAEELGISVNSAKAQLKSIKDKLKITSITELS